MTSLFSGKAVTGRLVHIENVSSLHSKFDDDGFFLLHITSSFTSPNKHVTYRQTKEADVEAALDELRGEAEVKMNRPTHVKITGRVTTGGALQPPTSPCHQLNSKI